MRSAHRGRRVSKDLKVLQARMGQPDRKDPRGRLGQRARRGRKV